MKIQDLKTSQRQLDGEDGEILDENTLTSDTSDIRAEILFDIDGGIDLRISSDNDLRQARILNQPPQDGATSSESEQPKKKRSYKDRLEQRKLQE